MTAACGVVTSAISDNMSAGALGEEQTVTFAREDVWRSMSEGSGGPHWAALIAEAIEYREESAAAAEVSPDAVASDWEDNLPHGFADAMSVYTRDRVEAVWNLDLWHNQAVADEVEQLGGAHDAIRGDGTLDWDRASALYLYAARSLTMRAVIRAAGGAA